MITVPQFKHTGLIFLAIVIVSFSFSMANGLRHGEARTLANWADICIDGFNNAALVGFGWIALKSPLAKGVTEMLNQEKTSTTLSPSGEVKVETVKTSVETSKPQEAK